MEDAYASSMDDAYVSSMTHMRDRPNWGGGGLLIVDTLIPVQFSPLPPSCLSYTACDVSKQNGGTDENCVWLNYPVIIAGIMITEAHILS